MNPFMVFLKGVNLMRNIREELLQLEDLPYKDFLSRLIPTVDKNKIIGIRAPILRKYAKELFKKDLETAFYFLEDLPHQYYEENNLHGFLIEETKDFETALQLTNDFLPFIDNWASCDSFSPKVFKKHPERMFKQASKWIESKYTYTVRYGIGVYLSNFLDDEFKPEILEIVSRISSEEYYVKMMIAWFFSYAVIKQKSSTLPYLEDRILEKWIHNKTIQKCIDSRRITEEEKNHLRSLRIK